MLRELPRQDPEQLLERRNYADPTFLSLFLPWLDEQTYYDPKVGLRWARMAPDQALKVPERDGPEGRQEHREHQFRSWVALGSANRAYGDHAASDEAYREAEKLARGEVISEAARADRDRRLAFLRACQGRADQALDLATTAEKAHRKFVAVAEGAWGKAVAVAATAQGKEQANAEAGVAEAAAQLAAARLLLGKALIAKGYVLAGSLGRPTEAIDPFGEAVTLTLTGEKPSPEVLRVQEAGCNNLAMALVATSGHHAKVIEYLRAARHLIRGQVRSPTLYRLRWIEGLSPVSHRYAREG